VLVRDAIEAAGRSGVLVVAAAGERPTGGTDNDAHPFYPASYEVTPDNLISVQASVFLAGREKFWAPSNRGKRSVDLAAPGSPIYSTNPGNQYGFRDGTSMAAGFVTGAAALVKALAPGWPPSAIKAQLMGTADRLPAFESLSVTGARLNVDAATQAPVVLTAPLLWLRGRLATVTWTPKYAPLPFAALELALSTDGGATFATLARDVGVRRQEAAVAVPDVPTNHAMIRARCADTDLCTFSGAFAIR
jgi:subtilisin family serine protease